MFKEKFLNLLHRIYRKDFFIADYTNAINKLLNDLDGIIVRLKNIFNFGLLDEKSCQFWENKLLLKSKDNFENRRYAIRAKWIQGNQKNCISIIQQVCNSWRNGEIEADFKEGKIQIKFVNKYGIPSDLETLKKFINETKPAHLSYQLLYKYLLVENIHKLKTIEDMEKITLDMFINGKEN